MLQGEKRPKLERLCVFNDRQQWICCQFLIKSRHRNSSRSEMAGRLYPSRSGNVLVMCLTFFFFLFFFQKSNDVERFPRAVFHI